MAKAKETAKDESRDWKAAAEKTLTVALDRLEDLARDSSDPKVLESIIKTTADVVGAGLYLARTRGAAPGASGDGGDDD